MAIGEQAHEESIDEVLLADDDAADLFTNARHPSACGVNVGGHKGGEMSCGVALRRLSAHLSASGGAGFVYQLTGALRLLNRCLYKSGEEGVRLVGLRLELGVVLDAHHPRVILDLDDFDQAALGVYPADA